MSVGQDVKRIVVGPRGPSKPEPGGTVIGFSAGAILRVEVK
jgi:hypothetical protein